MIFDLGGDSLVRIPTLEPLRGSKAHVGALLDSVYLHSKAHDHLDGRIWPILGRQVQEDLLLTDGTREGLPLVAPAAWYHWLVGLAVLATLSTERTNSLLADGEGQLQALTSGYHVAYLVGAALAAIAVAIAVFVLRSPRPQEMQLPQEEPEPALSEAG